MPTLSPPGAEFTRLRSTFPPAARGPTTTRRALIALAAAGSVLGAGALAIALFGSSAEGPARPAVPSARVHAEDTARTRQTGAIALVASGDPAHAPGSAMDASTAIGSSASVETTLATDEAPAAIDTAAPRSRGPRGRGPRVETPALPLAARAVAPTVAPAGAAPVDADALVAEALGAFMRGQLPQARALYQRATVAAPRNTAAWRGLGLVAARLGQRRDATRAFERYLALAPDAPDSPRIRGQLDQLAGAPAE